jgi:CHAT domain-containing protein/tetratricopeptide (TPR) repeat protein
VSAGTWAVVVLALSAAADENARRRVQEGLDLLERRSHAEAEKTLRTGLQLAEAAADLWAQAESHRGLGVIYNARGDYRQARAELTLAVALHGRNPDLPRPLAQARNDLAFTEWASGNPDKARELYQQALAGFEAARDAKGKAKVLYNLAFLTYSVEERLDRRLPDALAAAREVGDLQLEGKIHHLWGDTWFRAGDFQKASGELDKALTLLDRRADFADRARVFNSLARLYAAHQRLERALEYCERAAELQRQLSDRQGLTYSLGMIASAQMSLGALDKAGQVAAEAVSVARQTGSKSLLAGTLTNLGHVEIRRRRYPEAMALFEESLKSWSDPGGRTHARMAQACLESGRVSEAFGHAEEAVRLAALSKAGEDRAQAHYWRARVLDRTGRGSDAVADIRQTLEWQETLRAKLIPTDYLKRGYQEGNAEVSRFAVDLLMRQQLVEDALAVAEQSRARAFLDLLASRALEQRSEPDGTSPKGGRDEPHIASLAAAPLPTVELLRKAAARRGSTVLVYWCGNKATFAWAVKPSGSVRGVRVAVTERRLEELVGAATAYSGVAASLVRGAGSSGRGPAAPGARRELHRLLLAPLAGDLTSGEQVTVVPHGPLHRLSFAALESGDGRYFIEDHPLSYVPAGSLLNQVSRAPDSAAPVLVIADPRNMPADPDGHPLGALPGARREAAEVARVAGKRATVLTGAGALEAVVKSQVGDKRIVHFATHGILSDRKPFDSFLALGGGDGQDGRLTAGEIYSLEMKADLVVLSACRTAGGAITGDGIVGLSRAFFYAGTSSLMATLWDVADEPSRQLVSRFYRHYGRLGKSEALRAAQLEIIRALRARQLTVKTPFGAVALPEHPVFWAGYVILGAP